MLKFNIWSGVGKGCDEINRELLITFPPGGVTCDGFDVILHFEILYIIYYRDNRRKNCKFKGTKQKTDYQSMQNINQCKNHIRL